MTITISEAVVKSGALDVETLKELVRWRLPISLPEASPHSSKEEALEELCEALEQEPADLRVTSLDILNHYLATQEQSSLVVCTSEGSATVPVLAGRLPSGEYVVPWSSGSLMDLLTNGETHLVSSDGTRVFFSAAQEYYYGDVKAFAVCTPSEVQNAK